MVLFAISGVVTIIDTIDVSRLANETSINFGGAQVQTVSVAWGLSVALIFSIVGSLLALILTFKDRERISA